MPQVLRGDVFMARLDPIEGSERDGTRPVVVMSRDAINKTRLKTALGSFDRATMFSIEAAPKITLDLF